MVVYGRRVEKTALWSVSVNFASPSDLTSRTRFPCCDECVYEMLFDVIGSSFGGIHVDPGPREISVMFMRLTEICASNFLKLSPCAIFPFMVNASVHFGLTGFGALRRGLGKIF